MILQLSYEVTQSPERGVIYQPGPKMARVDKRVCVPKAQRAEIIGECTNGSVIIRSHVAHQNAPSLTRGLSQGEPDERL